MITISCNRISPVVLCIWEINKRLCDDEKIQIFQNVARRFIVNLHEYHHYLCDRLSALPLNLYTFALASVGTIIIIVAHGFCGWHYMHKGAHNPHRRE